MRNTGYRGNKGDYRYITVDRDVQLLEFLIEQAGQSRSKIKATPQGRGIKVDGKCVTQFDFAPASRHGGGGEHD